MHEQRLRLGLIGCGRMASEFYLPACRQIPDVVVSCLVDAEETRAEALARRFGVAFFTDRAEAAVDRVDAVAILLPHHLHAAVAVPFLQRGIAVLCEKPLATSVADAERMIEASISGGTTLEVSLVRRFYPSARIVEQLLAAGVLGRVTGVDVEEGFVARRPATASWLYARDLAGGGVLITNAIHVLDLVLWWLNGAAALLDYHDDGFSGVEANALLNAELRCPEPVHARFEFSLMRRLRNTVRVTGDRGTLEVPMRPANQVTLHLKDRHRDAELRVGTLTSVAELEPEVSYFAQQVRQFLSHVRGRVAGFASGDHHFEAYRLIMEAYARRRPALKPWEAHGLGLLHIPTRIAGV